MECNAIKCLLKKETNHMMKIYKILIAPSKNYTMRNCFIDIQYALALVIYLWLYQANVVRFYYYFCSLYNSFLYTGSQIPYKLGFLNAFLYNVMLTLLRYSYYNLDCYTF